MHNKPVIKQTVLAPKRPPRAAPSRPRNLPVLSNDGTMTVTTSGGIRIVLVQVYRVALRRAQATRPPARAK